MPDRDRPPSFAWSIRPVADGDKEWLGTVLTERWGGPAIVTRGVVHNALELPGFVAVRGDTLIGVATYHILEGHCQLVSLDALEARLGIGTALLAAVADAARRAGCRRVWLVTTNDNLDALRFYQRRGFRLRSVHPNALEHSRELKPSIPRVGRYAIPLRDEIELEAPLLKGPSET